jgi:predicted ATPase
VESRHRTLRATVEWSYQLLDEDEQRLFRHLAVFVDGVDLDTAELLAEEQCRDRDPGSVLARLVDASMLEVTFTGGTRYRMLETLRAFGLDRLAAVGEDDDATGHMIRWAVRLTARTAVDVASEREPEARTSCCAASWRTCAPHGGRPGAAALATQKPSTPPSHWSRTCPRRSPTAISLSWGAGPTSWPSSVSRHHPQGAEVSLAVVAIFRAHRAGGG